MLFHNFLAAMSHNNLEIIFFMAKLFVVSLFADQGTCSLWPLNIGKVEANKPAEADGCEAATIKSFWSRICILPNQF